MHFHTYRQKSLVLVRYKEKAVLRTEEAIRLKQLTRQRRGPKKRSQEDREVVTHPSRCTP